MSFSCFGRGLKSIHRGLRVSLGFVLRGQNGSDFFLKRWTCCCGSVTVYPFSSVLIPVESVLVFNESVEFFRNREFFLRGMFIFRCNQVFHIVPISLSTRALDKMFE